MYVSHTNGVATCSQSNITTQNFMFSVFLTVMISYIPESSIFIQFTQKTEIS